MKKDYVFFLGGHDLEMLEIRDILEKKGYKEGKGFHDHQLRWGASLRDYEGLYSPEKTNVCIELAEDIGPPPNYIRVDHHNELSHLPASIEQVAELLGIQLSRRQQLIAENDKGYIPAMEAFGASKEEIAQTRRQDRKAQGVTEEQEAQALMDIQHKYLVKDLVVVPTHIDSFSPITDQLYGFSQLLVHNDTELTYYGPRKAALVTIYQREISEGKAYHGGQENGFFGLIKGKWSPGEIKGEIRKIIALVTA